MKEENVVEKPAELNPRQAYINKLQDDLFQSAMSQRFIQSEEGKYVIDYITEVVSTLTNQLINKRQSQEDYIETRAKIDVLRKLKAVLEAKANDTIINKLKDDLALAQSDE